MGVGGSEFPRRDGGGGGGPGGWNWITFGIVICPGPIEGGGPGGGETNPEDAWCS